MRRRKEAEAAIQERFARLNNHLRERSRRLFAASEAMEPERLAPWATTRSRRAGGERQKATDNDPMLLTDLQELVESTTRGDPECRLLWTARRLRNLARALQQRGHDVTKNTVARWLTQLG